MKTYSRKKSGETQDVILDLNELCRLCMAKEDELVPIFSADEPIPLTLRIMACVSLEVFEGDGLPNKICHPCKFQLEKSYNFRKKCESSDMKLRQHLKSLQAKIGDVDLTTTDENESINQDPVNSNLEKSEEHEKEPSTEEDLVGVAQVAYIQPDPDPEEDPENITLPPETELINKEACTLKSLKREVMDVEEAEGEGIIFVDEGSQEMEDTSYDAIADAVKATLATQPEEAKSGLLPVKSKNLYEKAYDEFVKWCDSKKVKNYTENVLLAYFSEKARLRKASTLWSHYSMLKATINIHHNMDLSKYTKLLAFLKKSSDGYKPNKSKSLSRSQIETFLTDAADETYLMIKVVLIFGIAGACRRDDLAQLTIDDIQDLGSALLVSMTDSKTKIQRMFTVIDNKDMSPSYLEIYRKYAALRPPEIDTRRFFIHYNSGKCSKQVVGKNLFGQIPSKIAKFLKLPDAESYNGHCFRRSSATLLASAKHDILSIKRHAHLRSTSDTEGCIEPSVAKKIKIEKDRTDEISPNNSSFIEDSRVSLNEQPQEILIENIKTELETVESEWETPRDEWETVKTEWESVKTESPL